MSRKSSWWLRPQRKGASNRAALNEANYFMEHNKVLRERIKELAAENAKLRELAETAWKTAEMLCQAFDGQCRDDGTTIYKPCPLGERDEDCVYGQLQRDLRELGVEVDDGQQRDV